MLDAITTWTSSLQTDLELDQVVQVTRETPKKICIHCGKEVNLSELGVLCQSLECTLVTPGTSAQTVDTEGNKDDSSHSPLTRCTVDLTSDESVAKTVGDLRGNVPKSVPLDFRLENTFALYLYHQYHYPSL